MKTRVTVTFRMDEFVIGMQQEYWLNREYYRDGIQYEAELVDGTLSVETI